MVVLGGKVVSDERGKWPEAGLSCPRANTLEPEVRFEVEGVGFRV